MEEKKSRLITGVEAIIRYATPVGAVIAFLVGIYHYRDMKREEFRKEFWEHRYEVYQRLNHLTSSIAHTPDSLLQDSLRRAFWITFWGESILIEDRQVYEAMRDFGRTLDRATLPDSLYPLRRHSLHIANACRQSLRSTWEPVPLDGVRPAEK